MTIRVLWGNLVTDSVTSAISVRRHKSVGPPSNIAVVNNTISRAGAGAGLSLSLWRARDITVVNNAIFANDGTAVAGSWLSNGRYASNWVHGRLEGIPLRRQGFIVENPRTSISTARYLEPYVLRRFEDAASPTALATGSRDIKGTVRPSGAGTDIGAFEYRANSEADLKRTTGL